MKATLVLDDNIYKRLVHESVKRYGKAKAISRVVNELLRSKLKPTKSMFGTLPRLDAKNIRDKHDRFD